MLQKLLTADEVAAVLNVTRPRVHQLLREGVLPACHLGRQVRVPEQALEEFIRTGGKALPGGWRRGGA